MVLNRSSTGMVVDDVFWQNGLFKSITYKAVGFILVLRISAIIDDLKNDS